VNPSPSGSQLPSFQTIGSNYRVIVPARTAAIQNRVKALVPGAFRTTFNGQVVMQAGVFREQNKANEIQQLLINNQLQALVVPINAGGLSQNQPPTTTTKPIPKGRAVIVIDPGHGGGDPGALGIGGLQEKQVVFAISRQVVSLLEQQGIQALLTRQDDREIDLEPRVQIAERANANVFVSIHANSINLSRPDINGLETYYYSDEGRRLAQTIHSSLLQDSSIPDRGVRKANFYVIKQTPMPATLVEVGFVTGREDAARLANPASQTRIAQAIARGIMQYVRSNFG
jgi:N-acetylmuramoyl-L-alanine amidase